ncbi:MAG: ribbon-helix-helix domain-containing protein [bacterium]
MRTAKIAITLDTGLLIELDSLVSKKKFASRSQAIQLAVRDKIDKIKKNRLKIECAKLDSAFEQSLAEEGMDLEKEQWPEY